LAGLCTPSVVDPNKKRTIIRFDQLTPLGRAIWLAGAAVHLGAKAFDTSVRHATRVAIRTRRAFREGLHDSQRNDAT